MSNVVAFHEKSVIVGGDFWVDASTGNWESDCRIGRERADLLVAQMRNRDELHPRFTAAMRTMVERGQFTGVEVGFFQRLLELAIHAPDARKQYLALDL